MRIISVRLLAPLMAAPLLLQTVAAASTRQARPDAQQAMAGLTGRWQLNADVSDKPPQPPDGEAPGEPRGSGHHGGGRPPGGGMPPGGGGGYPGGGMGGRAPGGGQPGGPGGPANPEDMAKMRDAIRAALDAPPEIVVTRKEDEVVFTATGSGDITRILVTGKKMKTTAGGLEHEVQADYEKDALLVKSMFGRIAIVDTWKVSRDRRQLERITKVEGGRQSGDRQIRRVYDRVE